MTWRRSAIDQGSVSEWSSPFRPDGGDPQRPVETEAGPGPWSGASTPFVREFDISDATEVNDRELELEEEQSFDTEADEVEGLLDAEFDEETEDCCGDHEAEELVSDRYDSSPFAPEAADFEGDEQTLIAGELENDEAFDSNEAEAWETEQRDLESPVTRGLPAGSTVLEKVPLLRKHAGIGPDLILTWNDIPAGVTSVDVVVHLHGYSLSTKSRLHIVRDLKPRSGLDWSDPAGKEPGGRRRPTLALLPRGHFYGGTSGRGYSFPALTTATGLQSLVDFGLVQLAASLGLQTLGRSRLILTAHSGGCAPLLSILQYVDPHEVHVFDGLYQSGEAIIKWATRRIGQDQATTSMSGDDQQSYMAEQGGALRVLFGGGTRAYSRQVANALNKLLAIDSPLRRWYRVEQTSVGHVRIPPVYGWRLLADASADVPNAAVETPPKKKPVVKREFESDLESVDEGEVAGTGATVSFASGARLPVIVGPATATKDDDYWDPVSSGNPLLDTSGANKNIRLSDSFTVRELTTSGGVSADIARIDPRLVIVLQQLRDHVGKGVTITSGFRSWKRNRDIYAARKQKPTLSQHCAGRAADIKIAGMNGLEIAKAAIDACGPKLGIGLGSTFAHIDVRPTPTVWDYGGATADWIAEAKRYQQAALGGGGVPTHAQPQLTASDAGLFAQRVLKVAEQEPLDLDGLVGTHTKAAIARFRAKYSLGAGDALDQRTLLALAQRGLEELAQQSIFPQVGLLDDKTRNALIEFKRTRSLGQDATLDTKTMIALGRAVVDRPGAVGKPTPVVTPAGPLQLGIDTASVDGNKNVDWAEAKRSVPVEFGIIRSNWGTARDGVFARDWAKMKDAGIIRGAYVFLRFPHPKYSMKSPTPVEQAKTLISVVGSLGPSDFPPTLDVEFPGGLAATRMTAQKVLDGVREAWKVLKDHYGVAPIIYTSGRVWHEDLHDLAAPDLTESPLWLARYPFKSGPAVYDAARVSKVQNPPIPKPWGDASNWWIHQYQGDAKGLPGFPGGTVDVNRFNVMVKGASGDRVKWVQRRLGIAQTGLFDDAMATALKAFQSAKGLSADGTIRANTFAYLCWSRP